MRVVMKTHVGRFMFKRFHQIMLCACLFGLVISPTAGDVRPLLAPHAPCDGCRVHIIPKHHLALHLWDRAAVTGNPKELANWYDEHLNATLAAVAKAAYPTV